MKRTMDAQTAGVDSEPATVSSSEKPLYDISLINC